MAQREPYREDFRKLLSEIEHILIRMPLPKLQRIGQTSQCFLYKINWEDNVHVPVAYFRGEKSGFDNTLRLLPGVAQALREINGLIRPYIQKEWTRKVADLNGLPEIQLEHFLFDSRRQDLTPLKNSLAELQDGQCFYSGDALKADAEVDHFIPWARSPNDDIFNLVVANRRENNSKRDFFADIPHLDHWLRRNTGDTTQLQKIALQKEWIYNRHTSICIARNLYEKLPEGTFLWKSFDKKKELDKRKLGAVLKRFRENSK